MCIPTLLLILKEVADSYTSEYNKEAQEGQEDATVVILGVVANIFQKIIELLARRLRKEPEEGKLVRRYSVVVIYLYLFYINLACFLLFLIMEVCILAVFLLVFVFSYDYLPPLSCVSQLSLA